MLMADNNSNNLCFDVDVDDDASDRLFFDIDTFWDLIDHSSQNKPDDLPITVVAQELLKLDLPPSHGLDGPGSVAYSFKSKVSDTRAGSSEGSSNYAGKSIIFEGENQYYSAQNDPPMCSLSGSHVDWNTQSQCQNINIELQGRTCNLSTENSDITQDSCGDMAVDSSHFLGAPHMEEPAFVNAALSSQSASYTEFFDYDFVGAGFPVTRNPDVMDLHDQDCIGSDSTYGFSTQYSSEDFGHQYIEDNVERMAVNDGYAMLQPRRKCLEDAGNFEFPLETTSSILSAASETLNSGFSGMNDNKSGTEYISPNCGISFNNAGFGQTVGKTYSPHFSPQTTPNTCPNEQATCLKDEISKYRRGMTLYGVAGRNFSVIDDQLASKKQAFNIKNEENNEQYAAKGTACSSFIDVADRKFYDIADGLYADKGLRQSLTGSLDYNICKSQVITEDEVSDVHLASSKADHSLVKNETCTIPSPITPGPRLDSLKLPCIKQSKQLVSAKEELNSRLSQSHSRGPYFPKGSHQTVQCDSRVKRSHVNDDLDVCILKELSEPARRNQLPTSIKLNSPSRSSTSVESHNHIDVGGVRLATKDERFIFRAAVQDISQPKSEANPPDGLLAVPLLKHQKIALSWMVQKETNGSRCSGGILADDQGLGKTISTIALILKERSPSSKDATVNNQNMEMFNLDDDDGVSELSGTNQETVSCQDVVRGSVTVIGNPSVQLKVRPAAGTLIVCPTSVLRQWSEELHNKVTRKADLSVLTYHGVNRTKDPLELAKYDIVLTTYAIVSMEVPKQPLVDKDEEEIGRKSHLPTVEHPSTKKRKYPPSSGERFLKCKKGDSELIKSVARPLAQVRWFRIILDEAQSIKNYKTQVARACWGLRAKRRWCLSGTPIQNSIDDLYSYFRFLKYDPYAGYKFFCSTIKIPIQKSPINGYRKLQAVLKTIMLRRTKGTILDGEPIINLPPKTIVLKKVEFTMDERVFYNTLEAESRAQFAEYEAAGTVKQNYVNILLMLLRLRQACDHPLLVRGCGSSSAWFSSVEMAKKLPREKQTSLLNCLEASLAICGICNDPPEDAVVTSCGHVFCNQCICEHLSVDDNQCPTTNCKVRLNVSSVFSKATLKTSLSEGLKNVANYSESLPAETLQPCSVGSPFDSSKIKAAIEVLQSLSKPRSVTQETDFSKTVDGGVRCPENLSNNQSLDLDSDLSSLVPAVGEKAIVFSQWTRMLDLLESCLKDSSINYRRLDGTMSVIARDKAVRDFNTEPEVTVIIMSLKAASLGLNMVAACHVLLLDLWWNPTTEDQAIDRAHRIGQTRPVSVLRLTVKDTVEDRILALQQKKREMVASAFGEDETGSRQTRLTVEDLQYLFNV